MESNKEVSEKQAFVRFLIVTGLAMMVIVGGAVASQANAAGEVSFEETEQIGDAENAVYPSSVAVTIESLSEDVTNVYISTNVPGQAMTPETMEAIPVEGVSTGVPVSYGDRVTVTAVLESGETQVIGVYQS